MKTNFKFIYNEVELELVEHFKYLGLIINFNVSSNYWAEKNASRAMYELIGKSRKLILQIDLQNELFDTMIVPIMLYGCKVWGPENYTETQTLHLTFLKHILRVHGRTTNNMVYGEFGRFSLEIQIKKDDWLLGKIHF